MLKIENRWTVVGVTKFVGDGCPQKDWPQGFSHVSYHTDWIWKTIKENLIE